MRKHWTRKAAMLAVSAIVAVTWSGGGNAQAPCVVERGQDPLDVLKAEIRHNVFIVLDTSGSMMQQMNGTACTPPSDAYGVCANSRVTIAKNAITGIMDDPIFLDASGVPKFNWGFASFLQPPNSQFTGQNACAAQSNEACVGLDPTVILPSCGEADSRNGIRTRLSQITINSSTPNGVSIDHLTRTIDPSSLLPGQKNFIIYLTDGEDTCECNTQLWNSQPTGCATPTASAGLGKIRYTTPSSAVVDVTTQIPTGTVGGYRAGHNAGLKAACAYDRVDPSHDGSKGDIFVIGLGTPGPTTPTSSKASADGASKVVTFGNPVTVPSTVVSGDKITFPNLSPPRTYYIESKAADLKSITLTEVPPAFGNQEWTIQRGVYFQEINNHFAWEASGASWGRPGHPAVLATDPTSLKQALVNALAQVGVPTTTVSLGGSVVGSVPELIPIADDTVDADDVRANMSDVDDAQQARVVRTMHRNNVMFSTLVDTPGFTGHLKAYNIYKVNNSGQPNETRVADFGTLTQSCSEPCAMWDAGERLRDRKADDRTVLFNRKGSTALVQFVHSPSGGTGGVSASDLGVGTGFLSELDGLTTRPADEGAAMVVGLLRGKRLQLVGGSLYQTGCTKTVSNDYCLNFTDGAGNWKLFDPTGGITVVQNPVRSPDADPPLLHTTEYAGDFGYGFYWENLNRQTVVYMGTNGGMMHAFAGDNGAELYGLITDDVLTRLKDFVKLVTLNNNGMANHMYFYAGAATVEDAFLKTDNKWHSVLAFGRGGGGKHLTALDITTVGDWDGSTSDLTAIPYSDSRLPTLLWNKGNYASDTDIYDGLGETWSTPVMGNVKISNTDDLSVMVAGGGYGCSGTDEGEYLYVLKLEDGSVYNKAANTSPRPRERAGDTAGAIIDHNQLVASPTPYNPHDLGVEDDLDFLTRVYIGDLQGNVYKLDTSNADQKLWTFRVLWSFQDADAVNGMNQPITAPAGVMKLPGVQDQVLVFVGSGGDLRVNLPADQSFKLAGILDKDLDGVDQNTAHQGLIKYIDDLGNASQFLVDLPDHERMTVAPVVVVTAAPANGVAYFATWRAGYDSTTCSSGYMSRLWAFRATSGQPAYDMDPYEQGTQASVSLGSGKVAGLFHRDEHLYVTRSGGIGVDAATDVRGSDEFPGAGNLAGAVAVLSEKFQFSPF